MQSGIFKTTLAPFLAYTFLQFVCMLWLCILFNIKDHDEDKRDGLKTLAVQLGQDSFLQYAKWLILKVTWVPIAVFLWAYPNHSSPLLLALAIMLFLYWYSFHCFKQKLPVATFVIRYDGLMVMKAALLIFAKLI
jgi:1,4-dihydroxy-2-naphthoate octaprenyltransferase